MWKLAKGIVVGFILLPLTIVVVSHLKELIQLVKDYPGFAAIFGACFGALLTGLIYGLISAFRRKKEYRSLLVAFAHELVEGFHRCVLYYDQQHKKYPEISFSTIFDFNDSSMLSRLASVTDNPEIVNVIMYLKKQYFQVVRHVEKASELALESRIVYPDSPKDKIIRPDDLKPEERERAVEAEKLYGKALKVQDAALAFFIGAKKETYPEIKERTDYLLKELETKWSSDAAKELRGIFDKAKETKQEVDDRIKQSSTNVDQNADQTKEST